MRVSLLTWFGIAAISHRITQAYDANQLHFSESSSVHLGHKHQGLIDVAEETNQLFVLFLRLGYWYPGGRHFSYRLMVRRRRYETLYPDANPLEPVW